MIELEGFSEKEVEHYQRVACGEPEALRAEIARIALAEASRVTDSNNIDPGQISLNTPGLGAYLINIALEEKEVELRVIPAIEEEDSRAIYCQAYVFKEDSFRNMLSEDRAEALLEQHFPGCYDLPSDLNTKEVLCAEIARLAKLAWNNTLLQVQI